MLMGSSSNVIKRSSAPSESLLLPTVGDEVLDSAGDGSGDGVVVRLLFFKGLVFVGVLKNFATRRGRKSKF